MSDIVVFRTWDEPLADMALNFLRDEGIPATKTGEVPRSVLPLTVDGLGEIEIRVPAEDADIAAGIIAARFSEGELLSDNGIGPEDMS